MQNQLESKTKKKNAFAKMLYWPEPKRKMKMQKYHYFSEPKRKMLCKKKNAFAKIEIYGKKIKNR